MSGEKEKVLVLFDFDGTITRRDTLFLFLRFYKGNLFFARKMLTLLPVLFLYKIKILSNNRAKERVLKAFLKHEPIDKFEAQCQAFTKQILSTFIRKKAETDIRNHQEKGARIVVVTASPENWVRPWCREMGIDCIGTRLAVNEGNLTGKFDGPNCHGKEKVKRIKEEIPLEEYSILHAYGDSKGDLPMLELAHHAHYKPFR